ncbi:MAG: chemotaxis protein CheD [Solirubrobacteraceae bacterium]|jgi:chemotaxis protein CheD|nr:chemotaxis protein CheD [Solirubrobacteraceae bacterium]
MTAAAEIAVRMGEIAVSSNPGDVLVSLGLGSCIGLALVDQRRGIAGLAHVMLPEAIAGGGPVGKFADLAVPALIEQTTALGTARPMLKAVLVGGAQMFALGGSGALDIGVRNDTAVRAALAKERITIVAAETGGSKGRTIRVTPGGPVLSKEAGGAEIELMPGVRS